MVDQPDFDLEADREWAERVAPTRRGFIVGASAVTLGGVIAADAHADAQRRLAHPTNAPAAAFRALNGELPPVLAPPPDRAVSEWGDHTLSQPTTRPPGLWPGAESGIPTKPRAYTAIKSYHAHFYFDDDNYAKAALIRRWVGERFPVELGDWNLRPRGPHVTPSFYFGFTNDLLPILIPWLQLNSLGLTVLIHPNTDDPRADHLYYTLWVNRAQPVNAFEMRPPRDAGGNVVIEQIVPNVTPTVKLEV